jgi:phage terminase small subunit
MGKRKKPTQLLKLEQGKVYASRYGDRDHEPQPDGVPIQPAELGEHGQEQWNRLVPRLIRLGVATDLDSDALYAMCQEWDRYCNGTHAALSNWMKLAGKFGLTPSDRTGIIGNPTGPASELEKMLA